jgi:predicted nucleic acid-binding protein
LRLVIDANALFAALIRDGTSRKVLFAEGVDYIAPEGLMAALAKHYEEVRSKATGQKKDFDELCRLCLGRVTIIKKEYYLDYLIPASRLAADKEDWQLLALALADGCDIWTSDKGYSYQKRVGVRTTLELAKEFGIAPKPKK